MGITGLLLCGFLVAHMGGNLLMFVGEDAYNAYAHALHEQEWFVKLAEGGLLALFLLHLYLAVTLTRSNQDARNKGYAVKQDKDYAEKAPLLASRWMFVSGVIVLGFVILHLWDFTFQLGTDDFYVTKDGTEVEPFDKAIKILTQPHVMGVYTIGCLVLGAHLSHGFSSAFRSLGLSHPKYNKLVRILGYLFALLFGCAFAIFPWWAKYGL